MGTCREAAARSDYYAAHVYVVRLIDGEGDASAIAAGGMAISPIRAAIASLTAVSVNEAVRLVAIMPGDLSDPQMRSRFCRSAVLGHAQKTLRTAYGPTAKRPKRRYRVPMKMIYEKLLRPAPHSAERRGPDHC